jgi:ATP-dependent Clp protease ATP-binding subunit ClpA
VAVFDKFSDEARRVVVLAHEEARRLDHDCIGAEHLLVAVLRQCATDTGSTAAQALAQLGIEPSAAIETIGLTPGPPNPAVAAHIPFTQDAKQTLEGALRESMGNVAIAPDHVLLALLRLGGRAPGARLAEAIAALGLSYAELRQALRHPVPAPPPLPLSPTAVAALRHAAIEAGDYHSPSIASAHLLLGILATDHDLVDHAFTAIGIDPLLITAEVITYLTPDD